VAVDQRPAVNPSDDRLKISAIIAMHIGLDFQIADFLIGVRHLLPFRARLRGKQGAC
jgi:hypothetical protein